MNKKWAVAFINFFDNDLQIKVVEAPTQRDAMKKAFPGYEEHVNWDNLDTAKENAFNQDWLFDIVQV